MPFDREFKNTASRIGIALLIMLGLFTPLLYIIYPYFSTIFFGIFSDDVANALSEIIYDILYFAVFLIPMIIFRMMTKKTDIEPMRAKGKLPKTTPLIILASVTVILCSSLINGILMSFFDFGEMMQEATTPTERMKPYEIALAVFTTAVVPGICEELLFRGTILSNLLPYGKTFAIVSSSVLFGLMHENPAQIFYTVMAGIILGYVYTKTNSILCVILIHFFNNLVATFQSVLLANFEMLTASRIIAVSEVLLFIAGTASIIYFIVKEKSKKDIYYTGCFEVIHESAPDYIEKPTSFNATKKFFLTPTVLIFTIACLIQIVLLLFAPSVFI